MDLKSLIIEITGEDKVIEKSQLEMIRDEQELLASRMLKCIESRTLWGFPITWPASTKRARWKSI